MANARGIMRLERHLDLFHELQIQAWVIAHPVARDLLRFAYCHLHLSVLIVFLLWVCLCHREWAGEVRRAFMLVLGVAIPVYFLFPMAPPRFFPHLGFVDVVHLSAGLYHLQLTTGFQNQFAAMPSLHCALALFVAIGIIRIGKSAVRWAGLLYYGLIVAAVLGTGNHFIVDATMGSLLAITAYLVALYWSSNRRGPRYVFHRLAVVPKHALSSVAGRPADIAP